MSTERILVIGLRMEQARSLREQFKDIFDIDFNPNATRHVKSLTNMDVYEKSTANEAVMHREKTANRLYPNVDFYTATTYHCIGLPLDLFTPMFVIGRVGGWSAHALEQPANNRLYRPSVDYTGPHNVAYTPIEKR